ncbi:unnamed protein product, partial [Rotaria socialis]
MASMLRAISGISSSSTNISSSTSDLGKRLVKWALILGVPTVVCVGACLVYRQQSKKSTTRRSSVSTPLTDLTTTMTPSSSQAGGDAASRSTNPTNNRVVLAIEFKTQGNVKYREKKFNEAIEAYTSK